MKLYKLPDIYVENAVAVGQQEGFIADVLLHPLDPPAGQGMQASIHTHDTPRFRHIIMDGHLVLIRKIEGDVRTVEVIIGEIFFGDMLLIVGTDDEVVEAMVAVQFHDVPEDRLAADLDHGFGAEVAFFGDTGAQAAGEDDGFHRVLL